MNFERMLDNAATCCQQKLLLDSESTRECIRLNIFDPLRLSICEMESERDNARDVAGMLLSELIGVQLALDNAIGLRAHANGIAISAEAQNDWLKSEVRQEDNR